MLLIWNFIVCDEILWSGFLKYSISCRDKYPTEINILFLFPVYIQYAYDQNIIFFQSFLKQEISFRFIVEFLRISRFSMRGCLVGIVSTRRRNHVTQIKSTNQRRAEDSEKNKYARDLKNLIRTEIDKCLFIFWRFWFWAPFFCILQ